MNKSLIIAAVFPCIISACQTTTPPNSMNEEQGLTVCPQDALQCPDGSTVGRSGPTLKIVEAKPPTK